MSDKTRSSLENKALTIYLGKEKGAIDGKVRNVIGKDEDEATKGITKQK